MSLSRRTFFKIAGAAAAVAAAPQAFAAATQMVPAVDGAWLPCRGQMLGCAKYGELFAVIGKSYSSGVGRHTFRLPDMRGCAKGIYGPTEQMTPTIEPVEWFVKVRDDGERLMPVGTIMLFGERLAKAA